MYNPFQKLRNMAVEAFDRKVGNYLFIRNPKPQEQQPHSAKIIKLSERKM